MLQPQQNQWPVNNGYGQQAPQYQQPQPYTQQNIAAENIRAAQSMFGGVLQQMIRNGVIDPNLYGNINTAFNSEINNGVFVNKLMGVIGPRLASQNEMGQFLNKQISAYQEYYRNNTPNMGFAQPMMNNQFAQYPVNQMPYNNGFQNGQCQVYRTALMNNGYNSMGSQNVLNSQYQQQYSQPQMFNNSGANSFYERSEDEATGTVYGNYPVQTQRQNPTYREPVKVATASAPVSKSTPKTEKKFVRDETAACHLQPELLQNPQYEELCEMKKDAVKTFANIHDYRKINTSKINNMGKTEVTHQIDMATIDFAVPVDGIEQAITDVKSIGINNESDNSKEYLNIINAEETILLDEPFKFMANKFDAVMEVVNNPKEEFDVILGDECIRDLKLYGEYVISVLRAIKNQKSQFTALIGRKIVMEFNKAKNIVFSNLSERGNFQVFGDIDSIDEIEDLIMLNRSGKYDCYKDDERFVTCLSQVLDLSLFAIFRKGEKCYLDPESASDVVAILNNHESVARINGAPARFVVSGLVPLTDEDKERIADAVSRVFVITIKRVIVHHNINLRPIDEEDSDLDMNTKRYGSTSEAMIIGIVAKKVGKPVILVDERNKVQKKIPVLAGLSFDGNVVSKRYIS